MIAWFITSRLGRTLAGAGALLLLMGGVAMSLIRVGKTGAERDMQDADQKEADRIRDDARSVGKLRDDEIVYRD